MNKKKSPRQSVQGQSEKLPSFLEAESRVFTAITDPNRKIHIFIGREEVTDQLRSVLRDEAKSLQATRLWEVLNASILNEAYNLALIQSTDFEQVQFAKALKHWLFFMINVINVLSKE